MKGIVYDMDHQHLDFSRHQIMIWIWMKEKQNIRIMITSYVKNVIKKLVNGVLFIIVNIVIIKLMVMKELI